ncbi:hypothetical protein B0H17DRAFT_1207426 [Mycena rosella]|uniref:Uncharacterized protein n=1 Tax=Mycena rosella TaxID=1033263 RepID=A0AAD7GBW2_MYCRO|nr:hypothetical protein B0H17DRAFT_1207426 [Mycena rosella]
MAALSMHGVSETKEGGDTYETVFGSLLKDRPYTDMVEHGIRTFQPLIIVCLGVLNGAEKQRRVSDPVTNTSPSPILLDSGSRPQKRTRARRSRATTLAPSNPATATDVGSTTTTLTPPVSMDYTTGEASVYLDEVLAYIRSRRPPPSLASMPASISVSMYPTACSSLLSTSTMTQTTTPYALPPRVPFSEVPQNMTPVKLAGNDVSKPERSSMSRGSENRTF